MTITTESDAWKPSGPRIRIYVTDKAGCSWIGVPLALIGQHEPALMRFRIRPPHAIPINVTGHACGISSLGVVAGRTALNVPFSQRRMQSAARANADDGETRLTMVRRSE